MTPETSAATAPSNPYKEYDEDGYAIEYGVHNGRYVLADRLTRETAERLARRWQKGRVVRRRVSPWEFVGGEV